MASDAADASVQTAPLVIVPLSSKRIYLDRYAGPDKGRTDRDEGRCRPLAEMVHYGQG